MWGNAQMYICICVYMSIYVCLYAYIYIYIYIFIYYVLCNVYYIYLYLLCFMYCILCFAYYLLQAYTITKKWFSPCHISLHWFGSWIWPACWPTASTKFSKSDPNDSVHESWLLARRQVKFKIRISAKRSGATTLLFL